MRQTFAAIAAILTPAGQVHTAGHAPTLLVLPTLDPMRGCTLRAVTR